MTVLYRCRTALSEVASAFAAEPPPRAEWSAELWPGRIGLVVYQADGFRRISTMTWGVRDWSSAALPRRGMRSSTWFREIYGDHNDLVYPARRCLIVVDSFAYPEGVRGQQSRTWFGFEDRPIFAWAGFWRDNAAGSAFCGFLAGSNDCVEPSRVMPAIVAPADYDTWFSGNLAEVAWLARTTAISAGMYREPTEEPWGGERSRY